MAYRPYPNIDRALRQLDRHYPPAPAIRLSSVLQSVSDGFQRIRGGLQVAAAQGFGGAGTYVLSTRQNPEQIKITDGASSAITIDARSIRPWTQAEREAWYRGEGSPRPGVVSGPS